MKHSVNCKKCPSLTDSRRSGADKQNHLDEHSNRCNQQHISSSTYVDCILGIEIGLL